MNISIADNELALILYNSFIGKINKKISLNKNSMTMASIFMLPNTNIVDTKVLIKFSSPLVVRDRNQETRKDYYHSFESDKFNDILKMNIRNQLNGSGLSESDVDSFSIKAIKPKKIVVKVYEKKIECSSGVFELS